MLRASKREHDDLVDYVESQAPDEKVTLAQKVYSERVQSEKHDIWDVHTGKSRWWVVTNPTNLYSQEQFPNMDLALTFHLGLCIRVPRSERASLADREVEPLAAAWRMLQDASEALAQADEVGDFQAIGVRCREALVAFTHLAQDSIALPEGQPAPKRSDFRAWNQTLGNMMLSGSTHQERRGLLKTVADEAWSFVNWLTHAKESHFHDAESAVAVTDLTLSLYTTAVIRHLRKVPEACPICASQRLSPERGTRTDEPGAVYERPVCGKCGWAGNPVLIEKAPRQRRPKAKGECVFMTAPLREFPKK